MRSETYAILNPDLISKLAGRKGQILCLFVVVFFNEKKKKALKEAPGRLRMGLSDLNDICQRHLNKVAGVTVKRQLLIL